MEEKKIHIVYGKKEWYLPIDDIIFVKADGNYSDIYLSDTKYNIRIQIGKLWDEIESQGKGYPHHLERLGRSFIINLQLFAHADPINGTITLYKTGSPTLSKLAKNELPQDNIPEEVRKHVEAIKNLKNNSDNKKETGSEKSEITIPLGKVPTKELLKHLEKNKRKEVLGMYAIMKELKCPIDELNDEHYMEVGYEYVDLGLTSGTLWAVQDLNQRSYFAWGELYENDVYGKEEYIHKNGFNSIVDPKTATLFSKYDAAHHFRGGGWRMPTKEECEELLKECIICWCITQDRKYGYLLTGPNGNHIFLPANGYRQGTSLQHYEKICYYWSSSNGEYDRPEAIKILEYEGEELETDRWVTSVDPYLGLPIRPVVSKDGLTGQEGKMKRMLILDDFFANDDDIIMQGFDPTMDGWDIRRITPPVDYDKAANMIVNALKSFDPEVVVAFNTSCFWGQKIKGRIKFLVEPARKMSEAMKYYMDVEQEGLEEKDWLVTQEMIDFYVSEEEKLTQKKLGEDCWVLAEEPWYADGPQFEGCNSVELLPPNDLSGWTDTWLFPIVKEVTDRLKKGQTAPKTLYEKKFNI